MNRDPLDTAAWRGFGMLAADESAAYDEASRRDPELAQASREMDRLTAAIAVAASRSVPPRVGQLERLHLRLGLHSNRRPNWLAFSGWAAAAALAIFAVIREKPISRSETVVLNPPPVVSQSFQSTTTEDPTKPSFPIIQMSDTLAFMTDSETEVLNSSKVETKRLIQEIEVLRDELESFQIRDRERFEVTPGMAWPIVIRMGPPDAPPALVAAAGDAGDEASMTTMLADAVARSQEESFSSSSETAQPGAESTAPPSAMPSAIPPAGPPAATAPIIQPSAIPIYDAARDKGTLVVSNLPTKAADENFNLWVTTTNGDRPILVGRLPEFRKLGTDSMDFSLGATAIVPSGFLLTRDKQETPLAPSTHSTILIGPR